MTAGVDVNSGNRSGPALSSSCTLRRTIGAVKAMTARCKATRSRPPGSWGGSTALREAPAEARNPVNEHVERRGEQREVDPEREGVPRNSRPNRVRTLPLPRRAAGRGGRAGGGIGQPCAGCKDGVQISMHNIMYGTA